jgi:hypothetical protein
MPVNVIKAKLNALRRNLPTRSVEQSAVNDFNAMVRQLEEELDDPEMRSFEIPAADMKTQLIQVIPGHGATYTTDKYCDRQIFKRHVEGLWEYLADSGVIADNVDTTRTGHSGDIHIHGPVTGSVIQQGDHNTATVNYQHDVERVLGEIRPLLNAAKLSAEAKQELKAEFVTVEAQIKSPKPKHTIIRESLTSARHILEHAFGAGMAHAYFPLLIEFFKHHH